VCISPSSRRPVPSDVLHSNANTSMRLLESGRQNTKQPTHKALSTGRQYILSLVISCIPLCAVMQCENSKCDEAAFCRRNAPICLQERLNRRGHEEAASWPGCSARSFPVRSINHTHTYTHSTVNILLSTFVSCQSTHPAAH